MQLVWATLIGWFVFQDFPDGWALTGMAVIALSGLLIALYERRARPLPSALRVVDPAVD
jgi:drug/metabolite transporter (DMT)-like permease